MHYQYKILILILTNSLNKILLLTTYFIYFYLKINKYFILILKICKIQIWQKKIFIIIIIN